MELPLCTNKLIDCRLHSDVHNGTQRPGHQGEKADIAILGLVTKASKHTHPKCTPLLLRTLPQQWRLHTLIKLQSRHRSLTYIPSLRQLTNLLPHKQ
jgi:hypothetical protein